MFEFDISIVIVNYNVKDFLFQCLKSIENSKTALSVETIVIDNNSDDSSVEFLKPNFPNVNFIALNENIGFGKANNLGFNQASGKYLLILNPDTLLNEDTLQIMYDFMETHKEVGISGCKVLNGDGTFQMACRRGFPNPWNSFCKLFGLQKLFPKSKTFASYNQSFRSIDETYYVDALIGAFMFCRKEVIDKLGGFDKDFFMYGEDLDLCFRAAKSGWKTAYVHTTSIIHYKGESTKRSSINEVKHFYEAMVIYAQKHYSKSGLYLFLLKMGISLRFVIAYFNKFKKSIFTIFYDMAVVNLSLIFATKIRFGDFFNFPPYAYPTVFIVVSLIVFGSMVSVGEYFESEPSSKKSFTGLMISFFLLSSLTFFFKDYAFSRGILLMTIGFSIVLTSLFRFSLIFYNKISGKESNVKICIVGINANTEKIINSLIESGSRNTDIVGLITVNPNESAYNLKYPIIGNIKYLSKIIDDFNIREVIITDKSIKNSDIINIISSGKSSKVRFHIAQEWNDLLYSRIINDVSGTDPIIKIYNLSKFRFRIFKRLSDIIISSLLIILNLLTIAFSRDHRQLLKKLFKVLIGKMTLIGAYYSESTHTNAKEGIISLAHISKPETLSPKSIDLLNDYYSLNYSPSLDLDILIKYLFHK